MTVLTERQATYVRVRDRNNSIATAKSPPVAKNSMSKSSIKQQQQQVATNQQTRSILTLSGATASNLKTSSISRVRPALSRLEKPITTTPSTLALSQRQKPSINLNRIGKEDSVDLRLVDNRSTKPKSLITHTRVNRDSERPKTPGTVTNLAQNPIRNAKNSTSAVPSHSVMPKMGTSSILPRLMTNSVNRVSSAKIREVDRVKPDVAVTDGVRSSAAIDGVAADDVADGLKESSATGIQQGLTCGRKAQPMKGNTLKVRSSKSNDRLSNLVAVVHPQQSSDSPVKQEVVNNQQSGLAVKTSKISSQLATTTIVNLKPSLRVNKAEARAGEIVAAAPVIAESEKANSTHVHADGTKKAAQDTYGENGSTNNDNERSNSSISKYDWPHGEAGAEVQPDHEVSTMSVASKQDEGPVRSRDGSAVDGGEKMRTLKTKTNGQEGKKATKLRASYSASANTRRVVSTGSHGGTSVVASVTSSSRLQPPTPGLTHGDNKLVRRLVPLHNDKNDQFVSTVNASSGNDDGGNCDARSAANEKQLKNGQGTKTNGLPRGSIRPAGLANTVRTPAPRLSRQQRVRPGDCYNGHQQSGRNINLQPQIKLQAGAKKKLKFSNATGCAAENKKLQPSPRSAVAAESNVTNGANPVINDRLLPKPMGQQVLTLMMLDAGLLPASSNQQTMSLEKSHVCLQNESAPIDGITDATLNVASLSRKLVETLERLSTADIDNDTNNNQLTFGHAKETLRCDSIVINAAHKQFDKSLDSTADTNGIVRPRRLVPIGCSIDTPAKSNASVLHRLSASLPTTPRLGRSKVRVGNPLDLKDPRQQTTRPYETDPNAIESDSENYHQRIARWLSPVRFRNHQSRVQRTDLFCKINQVLGTRSIDSSSCSSLNHQCPPPLALSNQLDSSKLHDLLKLNVCESRQGEARQSDYVDEIDGSVFTASHQTDLVEQSTLDRNAQRELKITQETQIKLGSSDTLGSTDILERNNQPDKPSSEKNDMRKLESSIYNQTRTLVMEGSDEFVCLRRSSAGIRNSQRENERQQQARSNSIGDHEFGGHQRLKQSIYTHQSPYVDTNQYYNQRIRYNQSSGQAYQLNAAPYDRSVSPMNFGGRASEINVPQRGGSIKYPPDRYTPRNHLHASLECLNVIYSDQLQNQKQPQQQQLQQQNQFSRPNVSQSNPQYSQNLVQNQHYATSYVMAPAPADTVINQNSEQDLAAAAMGTPPQHHLNEMASPSGVSVANGQSYYHNQGLFSRTNNPVAQSPLHRRISAHTSTVMGSITGSASNAIRAGHSSLSLASSTYLIEDKLQHEIKKLESELKSEKEKNDALNSQLNINSNLMAAFEQSLNTLNTRVRQLSTINERKDKEIEELRTQLESQNLFPQSTDNGSRRTDDVVEGQHLRSETSTEERTLSTTPNPDFSENDKDSEQNLRKIIDDLKRQLIEKDRLLTDTRLEALSAAHQLEQLESRLNGDQSILVHEDDADEGVMVANHSPSDSEVVSDSAQYSEMNSQASKVNAEQRQQFPRNNHDFIGDQNHGDMLLFTPTHQGNRHLDHSNNTSSLSNSHNSNHSMDGDPVEPNQSNNQHQQLQQSQLHQYYLHQDNQSTHSSSDYHVEDKSPGDSSSQHASSSGRRSVDRYNDEESEAMHRLLDTMLVSN